MNFSVYSGLKRINKSTARRLHKEGKPVFICPVYFRPDNIYDPAAQMSIEEDFDTTVMYYEHYNCINSETGRYAAFYTKMEG